ncbi:putative laccase [Helianthus annuus]|uniref:Laccase n=1 Tax=Helianthus annuus TaxID=4232 RepID=A0A9K3IZ10_HELAN|nr:putative laccase [Helianthus annuus]KAJ0569210.1 putative laccase [Helianthus annuus]KAJ0575623.1 putative laccase [Helianthus annuus]KAJ0583506.1 putative laccase [Helianthus annuus]KAJ0917685.1 putative laccase [Helianthus annuus]
MLAFIGQRGTLWWHAHVLWLRVTVHGAIVNLPKLGVPYLFPKPNKEVVLVLGEWWKSDTKAVINQAQKLGQAPNVSDAYTINGNPGPIANCLANVVGVDVVYVKPFTTDTILIAPGQTTNAIITTTQKVGKYLVAVSPFMDAQIGVDNLTTTGSLHYSGVVASTVTNLVSLSPQNSTKVANNFINSLKSLNSAKYPAKVPLTVDHSFFFFTIGLGINPCKTCVNDNRVVADTNNITFVMPKTALLQAHYFNISGGFTDDFPSKPLMPYNYTGIQPKNFATNKGNFNPNKDPKTFNLVVPVERNTVGVPTGGWTAIRFRADNPGVWFMHCHLEVHTTWGLKMAFVVDNGKGPLESVILPPSDLLKC